jgi:cytoskeletal protein CcmA (bactofilin family)
MARADGGEKVRITGRGSHEDVDAWSLTVNGSGTVERDVVAEEVSVDGSLDVGGTVESESLEVNGTVTVDGDAGVSSLEVDGAGSFGGAVSADHLEASGSLSVDGNLDGHDVESDGKAVLSGSLVANEAEFFGTVTVEGPTDVTELEVDGAGAFEDVTAASVEVDGSLDANTVNADWFEFDLTGHSTVDRIEADEVTVEREDGITGFLRRLLRRGDAVLEVDTVAGEAIRLEATRAGTVAGETVRLAEDVEVDVVYADDLRDHSDATVGEVRPYAEYEESGATGDSEPQEETDAVEEVREAYVEGEVDDVELEKELESAMADDEGADEAPDGEDVASGEEEPEATEADDEDESGSGDESDAEDERDAEQESDADGESDDEDD